MSYTVLARKWRPKNFSELVGQAHVMQALSNALDQNRLHHAYLFTGTRGVGKTTIARIFAKALNCEQGVSSTPCGVCASCQAINEGRFVDLIEVDAASRTKVEDTREILDNVQYAPTQGNYKVYLIDEVHMLSKSSFNALLKTLEEPPAHVKFLLATTDPHKLPITVLSRCLQFNLLRLTSQQIHQHLIAILQQENIEFEEAALDLIAKAADGSVRDSLSLLDQAIAYCGGKIEFVPVQTMLGLVDQGQVKAILEALLTNSAPAIRDILQHLSGFGANYDALLTQLLESLHQIAQTQILGEPIEEAHLPAADLDYFAANLAPETVQMYYQIALMARKEINLAPDVRIGFEMTLLRMLAFAPLAEMPVVPAARTATTRPGSVDLATEQAVAQQVSQPVSQPAAAPVVETAVQPELVMQTAPVASQPVVETPSEPAIARNPAGGLTLGQQLTKKKQLKTETAPVEPVPAPISSEPDLNIVESKFSQQQPLAPEPTPVETNETKSNDFKPQPGLVTEQITEQTTVQTAAQTTTPTTAQPAIQSTAPTIENWLALIDQAQLSGMALALASNSMLIEAHADKWLLATNQPGGGNEMAERNLLQAAQAAFGATFSVEFVDFDGEYLTPTSYHNQQQQNRLELVSQAIKQDPNIQMLQQALQGELLENSIKPIS